MRLPRPARATPARHPDLIKAFLAFKTRQLLRSPVPPGVGELAILRVARRRGCAYGWPRRLRA